MKLFLLSALLFAKKEDAPESGTPAAPTVEEWKPLAKISIKLIGSRALDAVKNEKQTFVGRFMGEAQEVITKEARNGDPYSYLQGYFRAVNAKGEKFESPQLFFPGSIHDQIAANLKAAQGKPVTFGYDIFANPDDKSSTGYSYAAKTLVKTEAVDRLGKLADSITAAIPTAA